MLKKCLKQSNELKNYFDCLLVTDTLKLKKREKTNINEPIVIPL